MDFCPVSWGRISTFFLLFRWTWYSWDFFILSRSKSMSNYVQLCSEEVGDRNSVSERMNSVIMNYFGYHIFLSMLFLHLLFIHCVVLLWSQDDTTTQNLDRVSTLLIPHTDRRVWKSLLLIKWGFLGKIAQAFKHVWRWLERTGRTDWPKFYFVPNRGWVLQVCICWHQWRGGWAFLTACADIQQEVLKK